MVVTLFGIVTVVNSFPPKTPALSMVIPVPMVTLDKLEAAKDNVPTVATLLGMVTFVKLFSLKA